MRRWLLNILAVISLLLFVATVGLWQRLGGGRGGARRVFGVSGTAG